MKDESVTFRSYINRDSCFVLIKNLMIKNKHSRSASNMLEGSNYSESSYAFDGEGSSKRPLNRIHEKTSDVTSVVFDGDDCSGGEENVDNAKSNSQSKSDTSCIIDSFEPNEIISSTFEFPNVFTTDKTINMKEEFSMAFGETNFRTFFNKWLKDDAKYSISKHTKSFDATEIKITKWKVDGDWLTRKLTFEVEIKNIP
eukprot:UN31133